VYTMYMTPCIPCLWSVQGGRGANNGD